VTASLPLFLVGSAAHCGGPFAKNSHVPQVPSVCTIEPPPNIEGPKLVPRFLFSAHHLAGCWRATKMAPNPMFKKSRSAPLQRCIPFIQRIASLSPTSHPAPTTDIVSFLCPPTLNLPTLSIVIVRRWRVTAPGRMTITRTVRTRIIRFNSCIACAVLAPALDVLAVQTQGAGRSAFVSYFCLKKFGIRA